jgi:hypothetical protein
MHRRTVVALVTLCTSLLACMGGDDVSSPTDPVPLVDPWAQMQLPVDGGVIQASDAHLMSVSFPGGTVPELTQSWYDAFSRVGFVQAGQEEDGRMDDELNRTTFLDAERELDVSVMMGEQSVIVVATLEPRKLEGSED